MPLSRSYNSLTAMGQKQVNYDDEDDGLEPNREYIINN